MGRVTQKLKNLFVELLWDTNALGYFHKPINNICIMYHGVDGKSFSGFNYRFCGEKHFEKQLKYFKSKYRLVSLNEYFNGSPSKKPLMAITFDDGYENWIKRASPIIEKLKVPVTFFITSLEKPALWADIVDIGSKFLDSDIEIDDFIFEKKKFRYVEKETQIPLKDFLKKSDHELLYEVVDIFSSKISNYDLIKYGDYWKLLTKDDIYKLSKSSFIEIGSHSQFHTSLGEIPVQNAIKELKHSKNYLESIIDMEVVSLAYPSGSYSRELLDQAERIGFKFQLAVDYLFSADQSDPRIKDRFGIYSHKKYSEQIAGLI